MNGRLRPARRSSPARKRRDRSGRFLGDLLCRLQQWVPEHGGKQERRVHAHIVMDTRIGILQHLFNDPLHRAVAIFREVAGNGREQRLEQMIFTQQLIGFVTVARL